MTIHLITWELGSLELGIFRPRDYIHEVNIYIDCATEHMTEDIVLMLFLVYIIVIDGTETTFNATYDHKIVEVVDNIFSWIVVKNKP